VTARPGTVDAAAAAALTGLPVQRIRPIIGGRENTSQLIEVAGTGRLLLQQLRTRMGAAHRLRLAQAVPPAAARVGVPVPALVAADAKSDPAWFIRRFVEGRSASATLRHPDQAVRMAVGAGRWCARWQSIGPNGLRPYRLWADATRLSGAAARWLQRQRPLVGERVTATLGGDIEQLDELLGGRTVVLAHGDFTPANLLVDRSGQPVSVIDVEFTRLADPLFDPAWWRAAVIIWSPATWEVTWPTFWEAYRQEARTFGFGDPADDPRTPARLDAFGRLRLLEILEHTRDRPDAPLWRDRITRLVAATA
jgi:aminoglycoside phosphotransferase (APT) family kinase protein